MNEKSERNQMIDSITNDLKSWMERDPYDFWVHVEELERNYLKEVDDKNLLDIYENTI